MMKRNMLELLEETAARVPERVAYYDDRQSLSFAALAELARRIGSSLARVTRPRQVVALLMDAREASATCPPFSACCTQGAPTRRWILPCLRSGWNSCCR